MQKSNNYYNSIKQKLFVKINNLKNIFKTNTYSRLQIYPTDDYINETNTNIINSDDNKYNDNTTLLDISNITEYDDIYIPNLYDYQNTLDIKVKNVRLLDNNIKYINLSDQI